MGWLLPLGKTTSTQRRRFSVADERRIIAGPVWLESQIEKLSVKKGINMQFSGARPSLLLAALLLVIALGAQQRGYGAGEQPPVEAADAQVALVRVHLPLTGNADQVLQSTISRVRDRLVERATENQDERRPLLVLQLEPHQQSGEGGAGSQFERVLSLSRFLSSRGMSSVKTVAYIRRSIRGHAALIALSCEEIVMAPEATIGEAGVDETSAATISPTVIGAYQEIAESRRTIPLALALGMIDASAEVLQIETEQGIEFALRRDFEKSQNEREVISEETIVPAGTLASFQGREGRQFGFVKFLASDRDGLARALRVPVTAIREEDTLAGEWQPTIIDLQGRITPRYVNRIETMLNTAIEQGDNWIGLRIDSMGGDLAASVQLATTLAKLDANSVRTVAYVPAEARGSAALAALACDQLIMHPEARLGAIDQSAAPAAPQPEIALPPEIAQADERVDEEQSQLDAAKVSIRQSLAPLSERSWSLLLAMIDPSVELFSYRNKTTGETRWLSAEEVADQPDPDVWQKGEPLADANEPIVIGGDQAAKLGVARQTVESFDELKQLFRITEDPPVAKPNWALEFVEALASPELAWILLMVGFYGLYIEMRAPGVGFGAFVGCVALMLFFWSQYLNGTAGWLEVLLFVSGILFILIEVFVLPGFGIFGLGGGAMVISSIILASLTFVRPRSEQDMEALTSSVGTFAVAMVGMITCVLVSRRYLPEAPIFRHLVLERMKPEERAVLEDREKLADYEHLVGKQGVAATDLRPSGKAEIEHQLIDVIAEAEPLDRGTPLEVVDAHANRVVVRATGAA